MPWPTNPRPAKSLVTLKKQIDEMFPGRSKVSDGFIGDASHMLKSNASDHNPNKDGIVLAFDVTHDPAHGLDIKQLAGWLMRSRDARIKYIIRNGEIMEPLKGWVWLKYKGADQHHQHMHLSVNAINCDVDTPWNIGDEDMHEGKTAKQWAELYKKEMDLRVNPGDVQNLKAWLGLTVNKGDYGFVGKNWKDFVTPILTGEEYKQAQQALREGGDPALRKLGEAIKELVKE